VVDAVASGRAVHGLDINFLFGTNVGVPLPFPPSTTFTPSSAEDLEFSRVMAGYWRRFADRGNPNADDDTVVHWQPFNR
jgi:carboxylesterase type B